MSPLAGLRQFLQNATEMSSARRHDNTLTSFPPVPSNTNPGDHELQDTYYGGSNNPSTVVNTAPGLTPYLGLRARLSQVWINRWTILILLILARALLAIRSLNDNLDSAKKEALSACQGVESMGSAMASMPHYMSQGINEIAASGVEKAVNGLMSMLLLSVTGVEEIVLFVINMMTSTYVCLITLAISGSLHIAIDIAQDFSDFLNKTLGDISNDISSDAKAFQDKLNTFLNGISGVINGITGGNKKPDPLTLPSLDKLKNIQLPTGIHDDLQKLNNSIPTFAQVQNFTNTAISLPFEEVKKLINGSLTTYTFDRSVFPVPQKKQLTFCSDNNDINDFFQHLDDIAHLAKRIFTGVLVVAAILVCIPMAYREIWRWRSMRDRAQLLQRNAFDPLDVVQIASRPYTSTAGIKAAARFKSTRRQIATRWFVAYGTSIPALFVLSLGLAGLVACLFQYILLQSVRKEVPALSNEVGQFADQVVGILNNASEEWAVETNRVIDSTNTDINKEVFGWVNTTTHAVNDTLNTFVGDLSDALNTTFGGTPLYAPITEVLNCLIGLKIAGIQKGLDWVSDNAQVNFPHLPNDTFSLGAVASIASDSRNASDSFLADPSSEATDKITNAVASMASKIASAIRQEAIISACVVLIWVIIVLIGALRAAFICFGRDKTRAEGGPTYASDYDHDRGTTSSSAETAEKAFPSFGAAVATPMTSRAPPRYETPVVEKVGFAGLRNDAVERGTRHKSQHGFVFGDRF